MSRPAYTTSGSGGVFEESGNYGAQPAASEPTGYGGPPADNGSEAPLTQPTYGPGGLEGQNQGPTKRPWLKWLIGIAILIIIILAVVLGAVLGTRHRGSSAYTTPQEGNSGNSSTTPAPVSVTSSFSLTSSIGASPTDSSATLSGSSATGSPTDGVTSPGGSLSGGPSATGSPGPSASGYPDTFGSSGVVSPSVSPTHDGSSSGVEPTGTRC
ncbi:hypothetical protein FRC00_000921 [Tulasnella sp. 408]|nr:hypothetical protein FRC00_000921 [Tulasnella sp. 408]